MAAALNTERGVVHAVQPVAASGESLADLALTAQRRLASATHVAVVKASPLPLQRLGAVAATAPLWPQADCNIVAAHAFHSLMQRHSHGAVAVGGPCARHPLQISRSQARVVAVVVVSAAADLLMPFVTVVCGCLDFRRSAATHEPLKHVAAAAAVVAARFLHPLDTRHQQLRLPQPHAAGQMTLCFAPLYGSLPGVSFMAALATR